MPGEGWEGEMSGSAVKPGEELMAARAPSDLAACRKRYRKQLRRYHRAIEDGHRARVHQIENWLLNSHTAKVVALAKASGNKAARSRGAQKKRFKFTPAQLDMMASALSCWQDPTEPAVLYVKEKKSGGVRLIIRYGVMRTAQQHLAVGMLEPRLWLHEGQYAVPGRHRTAAIEIAKQVIGDGYHWVIRGDINPLHSSAPILTVESVKR
jgi:hypothetical protein